MRKTNGKIAVSKQPNEFKFPRTASNHGHHMKEHGPVRTGAYSESTQQRNRYTISEL